MNLGALKSIYDQYHKEGEIDVHWDSFMALTVDNQWGTWRSEWSFVSGFNDSTVLYFDVTNIAILFTDNGTLNCGDRNGLQLVVSGFNDLTVLYFDVTGTHKKPGLA